MPRCQVHGIVNDTLEFVRQIMGVEINSATDNPVSFIVVHCSGAVSCNAFSGIF